MQQMQRNGRRLASLVWIALITILIITLATASCGKRKEPTEAPTLASQTAATATPIPPTATPLPTAKPSDTSTPSPSPTPAKAAASAEEATPEEPVGPARAYLKTAATTVGSEPVRVSLWMNSETPMYGAQLHLGFDSTLIEIKDANPSLDDVQIEPGAAFPPRKSYVAVNRVNNALGMIDFVATRLSPAPPLQGEIEIASFEVVGKASGSAKIDFLKALLADDNARPIAVESEALELRVER